ncbi:MAG: ABC transporter permease, partial [Hymenobacter sp.]
MSVASTLPTPLLAPAAASPARATIPRPGRRWQWPLGAVLPVLLLALWEVLARTGTLPPNLLPAPSRVLTTIIELARTGELWPHLGLTLGRVLLGFGLGTALGTVLGALTGYLPLLRRLLDPLLQGLRNIPSLAWVPL